MISIKNSGPCYLYKHTCPDGLSYIGTTSKDPPERWKNGEGYKENEPFYNAIQKYTWERITHEIIQAHIGNKYADFLEALSIAKDNTLYPNGYNLQGGGKHGYTRSQYVRNKISESLSKPLAQIDPTTGKILKVWRGQRVASRALGINQADISAVTRGLRKTAGGYTWTNIDDLQTAGKLPPSFSVDEERKDALAI